MLILEVISSELTEKSSRKYKCTSGPRKGQRVAKISTCSAPIKHHRNHGDDENYEPRAYVPKKSRKKHKKKKLRPGRKNIKSESLVNEYGGINKAKISNLKPGHEAEIDNGDGTKTVVDLKKNPEALTKNGTDVTLNNTNKKPGQRPNPSTTIKKGDMVKLNNENK